MQRLSTRWYSLQDTLWFLPALMTTGAIVLSFGMLQFDKHYFSDQRLHTWWLFAGGAEGARGVLSTIAGMTMIVATTAFSITIVALQLGSSQFSPRILRGFTGDRGNQVVLGAFIATFAYSLLILRSVRSASADANVFVPSASVSVSIVLALFSIASLIYFFHHATRAIQASVVIHRAATDARRLIEHEMETNSAQMHVELRWTGNPAIEIEAEDSGYVTGIDTHALMHLAKRHDVVLEISTQAGDYLSPGVRIAHVTGSHGEDGEAATERLREERDALVRGVRDSIATDMERTLEHDVRLGFRQLVDIALKALSPGINDPTTAMICIDHLGDALIRSRTLVGGYRVVPSEHERQRVVVFQSGFDTLLETSVHQIRHFGAQDTTVIRHLLRMLEKVADGAEGDVRTLVAFEARNVLAEALEHAHLNTDQAALRMTAAWTS